MRVRWWMNALLGAIASKTVFELLSTGRRVVVRHQANYLDTLVGGTCSYATPGGYAYDACVVARGKTAYNRWASIVEETLRETAWCMGAHCSDVLADAWQASWWLFGILGLVLATNACTLVPVLARWVAARPSRNFAKFMQKAERGRLMNGG
jgi:glutathione S-transferase